MPIMRIGKTDMQVPRRRRWWLSSLILTPPSEFNIDDNSIIIIAILAHPNVSLQSIRPSCPSLCRRSAPESRMLSSILCSTHSRFRQLQRGRRSRLIPHPSPTKRTNHHLRRHIHTPTGSPHTPKLLHQILHHRAFQLRLRNHKAMNLSITYRLHLRAFHKVKQRLKIKPISHCSRHNSYLSLYLPRHNLYRLHNRNSLRLRMASSPPHHPRHLLAMAYKSYLRVLQPALLSSTNLP